MPHPHLTRPARPAGYLALQEQDLRILELVHAYRFLDTKTIAALLHHQGSDWALQGRLKKLYEHRYLDRPTHQAVLWLTEEQRHLIYALGREGAKVLAEHYEVPLEQSRWTQMNNEVGDVHLRHTLGVAWFHAALRLAIPVDAPHEGSAEYSKPYLLPWRQGLNIRVRIRLAHRDGVQRPYTLTPDAFFGLQKPKAPPNRSYFFLEYERGTKSLQRFLHTKGMAYRALWEQKKHDEHFGIKGFRVLVIATTERKHETLRGVIRTWLKTVPPLLHTMWLLTSETRYHLDDPRSVLRRIWQTADDEHTSLFD